MKEIFETIEAIVNGTIHIVNPAVQFLLPVLNFLSTINIYLVVAVFAAMLIYMIFVRKHSVLDKLRRPQNYFAALIMFAIYMFFAKAASISLPGGFTLQLQTIVLPMAAKLFGPILGGVVGIILFMASFWLQANEVPFSINMIFISGISGMLYGWVLYARPTGFLRSLWAKVLVTILCNIVLYPLIQGFDVTNTAYLDNAVNSITSRIIQNVFTIPIYAVFIYIELLIMKKIRMYLADSAWTLKN